MADCSKNQVGVRNLMITFYDCDSDSVYGPISHELATDELPTMRLCEWTNEILTAGYVRRTKGTNEITVNVIRNKGVPIAMYQGCALVDISIEYYSGVVITGLQGTVTSTDASDGHEVTMTASFPDVDELLPDGAFPVAA